jgi:prolyl 4-hydroxylase
MKKIALSNPNSNPHFIGSWMMSPLSICDELVSYFESNKGKHKYGVTSSGENKKFKDTIDISVLPNEMKKPGNEIFEMYFKNLFSCYRDYKSQWPFLDKFPKTLNIGEFNLQRYHSGQHYQGIHTERSSLNTLHRVFAWMTYLTDVDIQDGGSTYFTHYDLEIQPKKGLTLIWPAEWTHAHKGNVLHANSKYIITGWMHFPGELGEVS